MFIYSTLYYGAFLLLLLLIDVTFLCAAVRSEHIISLSTFVFLQFLFVLLYEIYREWQVVTQGATFPINMTRVHVLMFEYFIYGFFTSKVTSYVEKNWRKAFRDRL